MTIAICLVSGGLDSATVLAYASKRLERTCVALSFRYGQQHAIELEMSKRLARQYALVHKICDLDLSSISESALTSDDVEVPKNRDESRMSSEIPATYVPSRNLIFLSIATAVAETMRATEIYIGANAIDYSGYPDCREEFLSAFEKTIGVGTKSGVEGRPIDVVAPLIDKTKAEIIKLGLELGVDYGKTWSCYDPQVGGAADRSGGKAYHPCGGCDSCRLRAKGFREAGIEDPLREVIV